MTEQNKWCIIPAYIYAEKRLNSTQKLLAGRIVALSNEKGFCYASNEYFAEEMGRHSVNISHDIGLLVGLGMFRRVIYRKNKRVSQRRLYPAFEVLANTLTTTKRIRQQGISEYAKESNTVETYSREDSSFNDLNGRYKRTYQALLGNQYTLAKEYPEIDIQDELYKFAFWYQDKQRDPGNSNTQRMKKVRSWLDKAKPPSRSSPREPEMKSKYKKFIPKKK